MFFLKIQGERVWNWNEYGWRPPLILDAQGRSTREIKFKHERDKVANESSEADARALFSIFKGIGLDEFQRIANWKRVKEACDILQVTHEGTSVVKISKLQMLATTFKNI